MPDTPLMPVDDANPDLVLASTSSARQAMLAQAGLRFSVRPPYVDEEELKASLRADGTSARDLADYLAEAKAVKVSRALPGALVLGSDQVLVCGDIMFDKPADMDHAAAHLRALSGKSHILYTAAVLAQGGEPVWRYIGQAKLTVRPLSDAFITDYLRAVGDAALGCAGGYQLEGLGAQLFERVDGDFFTILGLPLLPVLQQLRLRGMVGS